MQQGDVHLFQTDDDGDIAVVNGVVEMIGDFRTAAYVSLFGGNERDAGGSDRTLQWWGNIDEPDDARKYVSRTQNLLQAMVLTVSNLRRLEDAARLDLAWFLNESIASEVTVSASSPSYNVVCLDIGIYADGFENRFQFVENWKTIA